MPVRIAIPLPHSKDREYAGRSIPQYERAVTLAGGEPVRIPLDQSPAAVIKLIERCDAILLPGSKADVDPAKFGSPRSPQTAASDPGRDAVDELLLEDAYKTRKPILGICYGLQILNVYRKGTLVQHIPDFLPEEKRARVNHEAGRTVAVAHDVEIAVESNLAQILYGDGHPVGRLGAGCRLSGQAKLGTDSMKPEAQFAPAASPGANREGRGFSRAHTGANSSRAFAPEGDRLVIPVNSSHHQSADSIGQGLRVVARCPDDGIVEALEGTSPDHFLLAVQWHPERSVEEDEPSRAIFRALVEAARVWRRQLRGEFESVE